AEEGIAFLVGTRTLVLIVPAGEGEGALPQPVLGAVSKEWTDRLGVGVTIGCALGRNEEELRDVFRASGSAAERRFYEGGGLYGPQQAGSLQAGPPQDGPPSGQKPSSGRPSSSLPLQELKTSAQA